MKVCKLSLTRETGQDKGAEMAFQRVQLGFADNVAVVTLNHPEALNAVSVQMLRELTAALGEIEDRRSGPAA